MAWSIWCISFLLLQQPQDEPYENRIYSEKKYREGLYADETTDSAA